MVLAITVGVASGLIGLVAGMALGVKMTENDVLECQCPRCRQHRALVERSHERKD